MYPLTTWLLLVLSALFITDTFAHRDELSARRFRALNPATVASELDKSRNQRWHRVGFIQRTICAVLLAVAAVLSYAHFGHLPVRVLPAGILTTAAVTSLAFDILFNTRFGMPWDYGGTTAWLDVAVGKYGTRGTRAVALAETLAVLAGGAWWWFLTK